MGLELVTETIFWNFFPLKYLLAFNQVSFVIFALSDFYPIHFNFLSCPFYSLMISLFYVINVFHTARLNIFLSTALLVAMRVISLFDIGQLPDAHE